VEGGGAGGDLFHNSRFPEGQRLQGLPRLSRACSEYDCRQAVPAAFDTVLPTELPNQPQSRCLRATVKTCRSVPKGCCSLSFSASH
jgi:hypothetical protein